MGLILFGGPCYSYDILFRCFPTQFNHFGHDSAQLRRVKAAIDLRGPTLVQRFYRIAWKPPDDSTRHVARVISPRSLLKLRTAQP